MSSHTTEVTLADLMAESGVEFGTSGARGRVVDLTDRVSYAITAAFLKHLEQRGELSRGTPVAIGGDLRPSTPRIAAAVARAVLDRGCRPVPCGAVPSPALALFGMERGIPAVMVTGSHIPDDRNGIKYNRAAGEILKPDEAAIRRQTVAIPAARFDDAGWLRPGGEAAPAEPNPEAAETYVRRYLGCFPAGCLAGLRVGLYEHSAVGRDLLFRILRDLGAEVTRLGRSDAFVPVDTEAIREEDVAAARRWAAEGPYDALVSTDGDGDRPLVSDEAGRWLRGDVAGILAARELGAEVVVVPVSCNTAVDRCGAFREVRRTRIGSPYVIAEMEAAVASGASRVVGYEANGGFLTASALPVGDATLPPLPTRDAVVVILTVLSLAARQGRPLSSLLADLPRRFTASDRLRDFPTATSRDLVTRLTEGSPEENRRRFEAAFDGVLGRVVATDATDGARATLATGEVVHLRPSGNAPEFRCYTEADSEPRARQLVADCLAIMAGWRDGGTPPPGPPAPPSSGSR